MVSFSVLFFLSNCVLCFLWLFYCPTLSIPVSSHTSFTYIWLYDISQTTEALVVVTTELRYFLRAVYLLFNYCIIQYSFLTVLLWFCIYVSVSEDEMLNFETSDIKVKNTTRCLSLPWFYYLLSEQDFLSEPPFIKLCRTIIP